MTCVTNLNIKPLKGCITTFWEIEDFQMILIQATIVSFENVLEIRWGTFLIVPFVHYQKSNLLNISNFVDEKRSYQN